jgi:pantoate--beta-alanine ligase
VQDAVDAGERDARSAAARGAAELISAGVEPEYFELVSLDVLAPVQRIDGDVLAVVAARIGATRLIDNETIRVLATATTTAAVGTVNGRP